MEMNEAGAGSKPSESSIDTAAADKTTTKPAESNIDTTAADKTTKKPAGAKKKTKMVREKQEYIDVLLEQRAHRPMKPYPFIPEEVIQLVDPEKQKETRALQDSIAAIIKVIRDEEEDILEQYRVNGYAEMEVEVDEVDEEGGITMGN